ncbi:MAG: thioredoxin domain-containing protein [Spirosomataceae bacterium]|jgi:rhodanese-related sulfurtransferase
MIKNYVLFILISFTFKGTFGQELFTKKSAQDFEKSFKASPEALLIDLRSPKEFSMAHIKKSINADFMMNEFEEYFTRRFNKKNTLFLYSQSEEDAVNAAQYLSEIGYRGITVLAGGFEKWVTGSRPYISNDPNFSATKIFPLDIYFRKIRENKYVLVSYYTEECSSCKNMSQSLYNIDNQRDDLSVVRIDIDYNQTLKRRYDIQNTPTFILYRNGKQVWRDSGFQSSEQLISRLK